MPPLHCLTPEWSPQSSWQLTSILSQPKRPMDAFLSRHINGFVDFLGLRLHHWAQTYRVGKLRVNITAFQDGHNMAQLIFITGEVKKRKWLPTGNFVKLQLVFFFACVILSLYHRSFLLLAMKHLKQCHSDCDIVKSMSKNTPTSTLWPGKHLIFCAFASLQGLEILLKHCRSNLMLHCQIPSDAVMPFKQKMFSLYLNLDHILLLDKLKDAKSI